MKYFECPRCKKLTTFDDEQDAGKGKHAIFRSPEVRCKKWFCGVLLQRSSVEKPL